MNGSGSDDSSDDEVTSSLLDDDDSQFTNGMLLFALHYEKYYTRADYRVPLVTGLEWVESRLANRDNCYKMFRMSPTMFYRLHDLLCEERYGLKSSPKSSSIEALGMFLWMVGAPQSVRQAEDRLERSLGTVHSNFDKVLKCVVKPAGDIIKPRDPRFRTIHARVQNPRFSPFFDNCIGAMDGTHVQVAVPKNLEVQYKCRKKITTQNVLAVCDFNMRFTFVLAGWPGSVHDMRVFNDAMTKWSHKFPHPPEDKFYVVDSGYPNHPGYLAPYKGTKYHLSEYRDGPEPEGKKEIFNFTHSSLRNVIERSFGVLKMKWRILLNLPSYAPEKQAKIIVACMALHNFIRMSGLVDRDFARCDHDENYVPPEASISQPRTVPAPSREDAAMMNAFRESIALGLLNRS